MLVVYTLASADTFPQKSQSNCRVPHEEKVAGKTKAAFVNLLDTVCKHLPSVDVVHTSPIWHMPIGVQ